MNCATSLNSDVDIWFPFVRCIEQDTSKALKNEKYIKECAASSNIKDVDALMECYHGDKGQELNMLAYEITEALHPEHEYVPWGVVNDIPMFDAIYYLKQSICIMIEDQTKLPESCYTETIYQQDPVKINKKT